MKDVKWNNCEKIEFAVNQDLPPSRRPIPYFDILFVLFYLEMKIPLGDKCCMAHIKPSKNCGDSHCDFQTSYVVKLFMRRNWVLG